jgi:hypothetical protein
VKTHDLVSIRSALPGDKPFIYKTWLRGLYYGCPFFNDIPSRIFYQSYQQILDEMFASGEVQVRVACLKDDSDVILGYCAHAPQTLHWVYVKKPWRKIGVAKLLVDFPIKTVTHQTTATRGLILKYHFKFNPFRS